MASLSSSINETNLIHIEDEIFHLLTLAKISSQIWNHNSYQAALKFQISFKE